MPTAEQLSPAKASSRYHKPLDQFVVDPGETFEQSLSRAITWHIHDHSFSEISRTVSIKRLEVSIAQMQSELDDDTLKVMYQLLGHASAHDTDFVGKLMSSVVRASLRQKLRTMLSRPQYLTVCAYEFHLDTGKLPIAEPDELVMVAVH